MNKVKHLSKTAGAFLMPILRRERDSYGNFIWNIQGIKCQVPMYKKSYIKMCNYSFGFK